MAKPCTELVETLEHSTTVKPCFKDTRLIGTPCYNGQFVLSLGKESPFIFSKFNPLNTDNPFNMDTFYGPLSVRINSV